MFVFVSLCLFLLLMIILKTVHETSLNDFYTYPDLHLSIQLTMFDAPTVSRLVIHGLTHQRRFFSFYLIFLNYIDILSLNSHTLQQHLPAQVHLPPFLNRLPRSLLWKCVNSIVQPLNSISLIQPC